MAKRTMRRGDSLVGNRYGKQVVLRAVGDGKVEIRCDCGVVKATPIQYLISGQSKSCGCGRRDRRPGTLPVDIGGAFGRLTVIQVLGTNGAKREVLCRCECGQRKVFVDADLRTGTSKSCGCFRRERASKLNKSHGQAGKRRTVLYQAWTSMRERCSRPDRWPSYVGIGVFPEWQDRFEAFRDYVNEHLGPRPEGHSFDRIDNAKGYEPGNVRWATFQEQVRNRKSTVNITVDGFTRCLADWSRLNDITQACIRARLKYGWPEHLAVTVPQRKYRPQL
jgi:hypothetical protein